MKIGLRFLARSFRDHPGDVDLAHGGDVWHPGYGTDVVAFRFNRAGVLSASPGYFAQSSPDPTMMDRLALLRKGVTTWPEIRQLFGVSNWRIKLPGGGMLVYHEIAFYDPLRQDFP